MKNRCFRFVVAVAAFVASTLPLVAYGPINNLLLNGPDGAILHGAVFTNHGTITNATDGTIDLTTGNVLFPASVATTTSITTAINDHLAAANPHPQYALTNSLGTAALADTSDFATASQGATADTTAVNLATHIALTNNPHNVTKAQIGLGNVDNTSDAAKPISTATQAAIDLLVPKTTIVNGHALSANVTVTAADLGIGTSDSPTWTGAMLSGLTANSILYANGSKAISSATLGSNLQLSAGALSIKSALTGINSVTSATGQALTFSTGTSGTAITINSADNKVGIGGIAAAPLELFGSGATWFKVIRGTEASPNAFVEFGIVGAANDFANGTAANDTIYKYGTAGTFWFINSAASGSSANRRVGINAAGDISILSSTASTSTSTGALVVSGGIGVAGSGYFGTSVVSPILGATGGTGGVLLDGTTSLAATTASIRQATTGIGGNDVVITAGSTRAIDFAARSSGTDTFWAGINATSFRLGTSHQLSWGTGDPTTTQDTFITRRAAATLQLGAADSATPVAQTLAVQGARGGTDTDVSGGNLTIQAGLGTGNATSSSILFYNPTTTISGNTQQVSTKSVSIDTGLLKVYEPGNAPYIALRAAKGSGNILESSGRSLSISNGAFGSSNDFISGTDANYMWIFGHAGGSAIKTNGLQVTPATSTVTSGSVTSLEILRTYNQVSGTAANTDLLINRTETAVGSGAQLLIDAQVGGASKFSVDRLGSVNAAFNFYTPSTFVTTNTDANGVYLRSITAATNGSQKYSPRLLFQGQGWKTDATAGSQTVSAYAQLRPVQGTSEATSLWTLSFLNGSGGSYTDQFSVSSNGMVTTKALTLGTAALTINDATTGVLLPVALPTATTSAQGAVELATDAEVGARTDTSRSATPSQMGGQTFIFTRTSAPAGATGGTPGPYTWSIPSWASLIYIETQNGGSGGGSGRRGAPGTNRTGGTGGVRGPRGLVCIPVSALPSSTLLIYIGAGGAGGAAVTTDDTDGNNGGNGSSSLVQSGSIDIAGSGAITTGGFGGNASTSLSGPNSDVNSAVWFASIATGGGGGATSNGHPNDGGSGGGGGGGGGIDTTNTASAGATTMYVHQFRHNGYYVLSDGGSATSEFRPSGAGGSAKTGQAATNGGNGIAGGGGGGGGASENGFNSGAGGNGGDGFVRIICW